MSSWWPVVWGMAGAITFAVGLMVVERRRERRRYQGERKRWWEWEDKKMKRRIEVGLTVFSGTVAAFCFIMGILFVGVQSQPHKDLMIMIYWWAPVPVLLGLMAWAWE